jgi:hypothetical protein
MNILEQMEDYLKTSMGETLPSIRYFNGPDNYSDALGNYKGKTLEASLRKFFEEYEVSRTN